MTTALVLPPGAAPIFIPLCGLHKAIVIPNAAPPNCHSARSASGVEESKDPPLGAAYSSTVRRMCKDPGLRHCAPLNNIRGGRLLHLTNPETATGNTSWSPYHSPCGSIPAARRVLLRLAKQAEALLAVNGCEKRGT